MTAKHYFNIAKGLLFNKAKEILKAPETQNLAKGLFGGVTSALSKRFLTSNEFPSPAIDNIETNIPKDNWGTYGSFLGELGTSILLEKAQPNAAQPPTEGSITQYAPINPDSAPLKSITAKEVPNQYEQDIITGEEVPVKKPIIIVRRRVARRGRGRRTRHKTVNEMAVQKPKKKKKRAVYKVEV